MNIINLKHKFRLELRNGIPTDLHVRAKQFGNNMLSIRLAVRLKGVEENTRNVMKLCSDSIPKSTSKAQKKRTKTVLKIDSNFKWATSEAKVKHLLNSVNTPKIKYTNYIGKEFNMMRNELIMIDTLD